MRDHHMVRWIVAVVGALVVALGINAVIRAQALPNGPEPVAWDREACAHCHMHVGDPHFAAQLQTASGDVLDFDDPGCLFEYVAAHRPAVHAMYFRDVRADRWITRGQVAFVPAARTPMGYGFGAVERSTHGAITYEDVAARIASRSAETGAP